MKHRKRTRQDSHLKQINDIAIQLINVSKKYEIHHEKPTLVEKFVKGRNETYWALKDINLTIHAGEKVGIIGPNGAGKTTLLKIISGITNPTTGSVKTQGKVISLIDLEAGFHYDLTGFQNIYLSGIILGMNKKEINSKIEEIISYADIKQFIDAPLFTYSQGMMLRLGFSVAIHANPDVLILDEGFAAGDSEFQKKTKHKIQELFKQQKTILVVSHWLEFIRQNCKKIIFIKNGYISGVGNQEVISQYAHPD
jgi:lipopolysaccharide transport system ATP-binding protein